MHRADLLKAVRKLPSRTSIFPKSRKEHWITWLSEHEIFPRKNPNRNARDIYTALNNPDWIIWLAAASGVAPSTVRKAIRTAVDGDSKQTQAAAVRKILP
jgi:hypothetical protein